MSNVGKAIHSLTDSYSHSLKFSENSKIFYEILPYDGTVSYLYSRMPMTLHISPAICQSFINAILDSLKSRKWSEAITDDLLLFLWIKKIHMANLKDLLKALLKNGLKYYLRNVRFFRNSYMW